MLGGERKSRGEHMNVKMKFSAVAGCVAAIAGCAALIAGPSGAQTGHPAKGTWLGYWGPDTDTQRRVVLLLDWEARQVVGEINPGPSGAQIKRADIDYDTWTMVIEAELPNADGVAQPWVATGKLENLGSWSNRRYSGSYTFGNETGAFEVSLN
jgi:hypothetical protein